MGKLLMADDAQNQFRDGLNNVTQAIVDVVSAIGIATTAENINYVPGWRLGRSIPPSLRFDIAPAGAPVVQVEFSREQLEDCWGGLDRADVRQRLRDIVSEYKRLLGA